MQQNAIDFGSFNVERRRERESEKEIVGKRCSGWSDVCVLWISSVFFFAFQMLLSSKLRFVNRSNKIDFTSFEGSFHCCWSIDDSVRFATCRPSFAILDFLPLVAIAVDRFWSKEQLIGERKVKNQPFVIIKVNDMIFDRYLLIDILSESYVCDASTFVAQQMNRWI